MTDETIPRCPLGVIWFDGQPICYEPVENFWVARVQGTGRSIPVTPELREAIEADYARQQEKQHEP